ncbi:MAG: FtsX-like permease family protein, partial [Pseudomonadota bacterium]
EPLIDDQVLATANGRQEGVAVRGVRPKDLQANDLIRDGVVQGELEGFGSVGLKSTDVVVGAGLARALGLTIGSPLKLISPEGASTAFGVAPRSKTYEVSAIFNVGNEKYDRYLVFMPIGQAGLFFNERNGYRTIGVRLSDPDDAGDFVSLLRREQITDRFAYDWQRLNAQFVTALIVERNVMRIIMMIVVMITALNIITGVLMLVKNKARDIAILRTIGATRGGVVRIFLMTGSILGAVGVLTGLVFGVAFVLNIGLIQHAIEGALGVELFPKSIYMLDAIPAQLQWSEVAIVTGWAFIMTMLTTLIPSMWASRLDPVEALRNQ